MKRCPAKRCPRLIPNTARYCTEHATAYEARRGTPTMRGYGAEHKRLRAQWQTRITRGDLIPCSRCGHPITPGQPWDLDHADNRRAYLGPAHARCNRQSGGKHGATASNAAKHDD